VTEWRFGSRVSRFAGYTASTFLTATGILIDAGMPSAAREFAALVERHDVRGAMLTHHHEDHAGNVAELVARRIPIWMAAETATSLAAVAPIRAYRRLTWGAMPSLTASVTPLEPGQLMPVATPGHAADHHVFWDAGTRTLFGGDLYLGTAVRIMQRTEDPWQLLDSLERTAALEPERLFDAHRGLVVDAAAALRAKAAWLRETIDAIAARITRGDDDTTILRTLLGGESLVGRLSGGEYARRNLVRAVRAGRSAMQSSRTE
jgi:glyoxylase-like metal-dependent hydrolase (beta-lactamase superfamily II)